MSGDVLAFLKTHLIAPGSTVTTEPTIFVATGNVLVSTTLIEPPANGVALICESLKVKGFGTVPAGLEGVASFAAGGAGAQILRQL